MPNKSNQFATVGAALAFIVVLFFEDMTGKSLNIEQASGLTGALTVIFGYGRQLLERRMGWTS